MNLCRQQLMVSSNEAKSRQLQSHATEGMGARLVEKKVSGQMLTWPPDSRLKGEPTQMFRNCAETLEIAKKLKKPESLDGNKSGFLYRLFTLGQVGVTAHLDTQNTALKQRRSLPPGRGEHGNETRRKRGAPDIAGPHAN